ncbi:penicillin-binding protein 2 [Entomospira culicis]|uniref:Penicillin-binding protein 2 n=1 Tax=Entomospira culicis TaxID=2719989 RepID=A0A968GDR3_9SPIO|nr:penicillin-binding protein 2 [Entomospira culicis]NIZ18525.1 penicillin-binding protein 2 [Entomospira culicis]NIZ68741.1 penicillin-binding protein 2 [Entomospira culicis]WDI37337.1 penicillin-binding protein 2 [Entomospira culicis]WDI38966.1 penicillin-binding protein 2 [Entomospira culicis]
MEDKFLSKERIFALMALVVILLSIFMLRVFHLQIKRGNKFSEVSETISTSSRLIPPRRGFIYDRNGVPLVFHENFFTLKVIPAEVGGELELQQLKERLAYRLNVSPAFLNRRLPDTLYRSYDPVLIREDVDFTQIAYFAENKESFPGLIWEAQAKRIYSEEAGIAHILGYVAEISEDELQILYNEGYRRGDKIGKTGVEKSYDKFLRGTAGRQFFMVDARGRPVRELEEERKLPQNGSDIYLTIDMRVQKLAYDAMAGRRGSVVVLKPATGEILAMVSNPVFNANTFSESGERGFAAQISNPNFPFINRAISAVYPPASTFKIVTHATIIEKTNVSPDFRVHCSGFLTLGNMRFNDHPHHKGGMQNLREALGNSCNVYFWTIARDYLGKDSRGNHDPAMISEVARDFGLGASTDIDLPNEKSGMVPDKAWKEDIFNSAWVGGDTLNMAIGQGFLQVTPLQVANVGAMVANTGVIYKPRIVKRIHNEESGFSDEHRPHVLHEASISSQTWQRLAEDMRWVVTDGTGRLLTRVVTAAGKTGTGETGIAGHYHDWFVAYAPYQTDDPTERIVVVVQIEANDNYEWWSTKITDLIIQGYFAEQDYHDVLRTLRPWYMNWRAITGDSYVMPSRPLPATAEVLAQLEGA